MRNQKTLLFIGAHPDDETFGIGGTLAKYAAVGIKVYYACATRGEAGSVNLEHMERDNTLGDLRWDELKCAAQILGLTDVIHLGYRDSGMSGSEHNNHPDALAAAPVDQVTNRVIKVVRDVKPDVVITFDPIGGYRHPDHIAIHDATVKAFYAAADSTQYPEAGPAHQSQKLYFTVFPRRILKIVVKLLPLFGQDPRRFGRNKDVDIASMAEVDFPVHVKVRLTKEMVETRERAAACYKSQDSGGSRRAFIISVIFKLFGQRDLFMRAYPAIDGRREKDLFEGVL